MDVFEALARRRSVRRFDPTAVLDEQVVARLFETLRTVPTSYNLQHHRCIAVRDPALRAALAEAAHGQRQVADCSLVVVILGWLRAFDDVARTHPGLSPERQERLARNVRRFYGPDPQLQRDEALRSASFAAMTLMTAAAALGLDTCPMIGFDPERVRAICRVPEDYLVALLLCVGRAAEPPGERPHRLAVAELVRRDTWAGPPEGG